MAEKAKSYLEISRKSKNKSRDTLCAEMKGIIDSSTLFRYEQDPSRAPSDIMNIIIDHLGDERIAYLYSRDNHVAARFIPEGVPFVPPLEAVTMVELAVDELQKELKAMKQAALDGKISKDELPEWLRGKSKLVEVVKGYCALEIADGANINHEDIEGMISS